MKKISLIIGCLLLVGNIFAKPLNQQAGAIYFGLQSGYGSTNWSRIRTKDSLLEASLPNRVKDTGPVVGFFAGINVGKHSGIELDYKRFKNSKICFAYNVYKPEPFCMISHTQNISLFGKLRVAVGSRAEVYSVLGGTYIMRWDTLTHKKAIGGLFGAGFNVAITDHVANGLEFDFATGKAGVNEVPAKSYVPFLTSINYKLMFYL